MQIVIFKIYNNNKKKTNIKQTNFDTKGKKIPGCIENDLRHATTNSKGDQRPSCISDITDIM